MMHTNTAAGLTAAAIMAGGIMAGAQSSPQSPSSSTSSATSSKHTSAAHQQQKDAIARAAEAVDVPDSPAWLGSVRLPSPVLADGKRLSPGRYRLRLTGEAVTPDVVGQLEKLEQWVEFQQGAEVKGRALASLVPEASIGQVAEARPPRPGRTRIERLKGNEYLRIWHNHRGTHVLLHLPLAGAR